jgi:hypothetical protein
MLICIHAPSDIPTHYYRVGLHNSKIYIGKFVALDPGRKVSTLTEVFRGDFQSIQANFGLASPLDRDRVIPVTFQFIHHPKITRQPIVPLFQRLKGCALRAHVLLSNLHQEDALVEFVPKQLLSCPLSLYADAAIVQGMKAAQSI